MSKMYFHDTAELGWNHVADSLKLRECGASDEMIGLMRIAYMTGIIYACTHRLILDEVGEEAEKAMVKAFESNKERLDG